MKRESTKRNSRHNHVRVRKVKIKLPREMRSGTREYREKRGGTTRKRGRKEENNALSCTIDFKNKMAIGQCSYLTIHDFLKSIFTFLLPRRHKNVMLYGSWMIAGQERLYFAQFHVNLIGI